MPVGQTVNVGGECDMCKSRATGGQSVEPAPVLLKLDSGTQTSS